MLIGNNKKNKSSIIFNRSKYSINYAINKIIKTALIIIDGYYFTTRYPGDDSFIASEEDVDRANTAIEKTRAFVLDKCKKGYLKFWVEFASDSICQINTFFKEKGGKICFPPFIMVKFNYKVFGGKER